MVTFTAEIKKFAQKGEKTGWSYIELPAALAQKLKPGQRQAFRVKGRLDELPVAGLSLLPMGNGDFILPINGHLRRKLRKSRGDSLFVQLQADNSPQPIAADLLACLQDEPRALKFFNTLAPSHQRYFSKWIESARTEPTRTRRIAQAVNALAKDRGYGEMLRAQKGES